jgi:DNA-binding transcriptional LysR family regulator
MIFRHLRYFLAVAEDGSLARAAARVHVAQPALSRQIRDLEMAIGAALFERSHAGVRLTSAGEALVPRARAIVERLEIAIEATQQAHAGGAGVVRLVLSPTVANSQRISQTLAEIRDRLPLMRFETHERLSDEHAPALKSGDVDMAIGPAGIEDPAGIQSHTLFVDVSDCALVGTDHPLAREASVTLDQLRGERLHYFGKSVARLFPHISAEFARLGLVVHEEHASAEAIFWHVAAGRGWTVGLRSQREMPPSGTALVTIRDLRIETAIVVRSRAGDESPSTARVLEQVRELFPQGPELLRPAAASPDVPAPARGLEERHLRALLVAVAERSLSRGADRLGITQSGLSRQISGLEAILGVKLLDRLSGSVSPTAAGRELVAHAEEILALCESDLFGRQAGSLAGRCRIAMVPTQMNDGMVLDVIRRLARTVPDLTFDVTEMLAAAVQREVSEERADVGVSNSFVPVDEPGLARLQLTDDFIECALLPESHPLARRSRIQAADLADVPFLFFARDRTPHLYEMVLNALEAAGMRPVVKVTVTGPRAARAMVAASMGWTVGMRSQCHRPENGVVGIPVDGLQLAAGPQLLWRRSETDPRVLAVIDAFRAWRSRHHDSSAEAPPHASRPARVSRG